MREIILRLKAETPRFFRKIIRICIGAGGLATGIQATEQVFPAWHCPAWLDTVSIHGITISVVAGVVAKFAVKDPEVLKQEEKK